MPSDRMKSVIRSMKNDDLPDILALINKEGWEYDLVDLVRILEIDQDDSVVAVSDGGIIGGITVACHNGRGILGHVVVEDRWRKKGVGKEMLLEVIRRLESKKIDIIELYSVPTAVDFYRRHSFRKIGDLMIFVGTIKSPLTPTPSLAEVEELTVRDLEDVTKLDREISKFERRNIIEKLMIPHLDESVGLFEGDRLTGFALGRQSGESAEIGPWIMENPNRNDAVLLFNAAMNKMGNRKTFVEVPSENNLAHQIVLESGLNPQYPVQRLVRTKLVVEPFGPGVMSYSALEYG